MTTPDRLPTVLLAVVLIIAATSAPAWPRGPHRLRPPAHAVRPAPTRPHVVSPRAIRVHDGDTFYVGSETIRLRGIDTPELGQPGAAEAKWRLIQLLRWGPVTIVPHVEDVYGRTVADVFVGGQSVADILRREGFQKPIHPGGGRRT